MQQSDATATATPVQEIPLQNDASGRAAQDKSSTPRIAIAVDDTRKVRALNVKAAVDNVNFYYGQHRALKNLTIPIADRQVTALIGPSGCGKSTFLRCFNRMHDLQPDTRYEGSITLHPDNLNLIGPGVDPIEVRMRIGMVFQKPNPFPHLDRIHAGTDQIDVVGPQHDGALVAGVGLQIVHPVEAAKEGALAAARRTDESGHLVLWDREIDALERLIAAVPEVERIGSRLGRVGAHGFAVLDRDRNAGRPGRGAG